MNKEGNIGLCKEWNKGTKNDINDWMEWNEELNKEWSKGLNKEWTKGLNKDWRKERWMRIKVRMSN